MLMLNVNHIVIYSVRIECVYSGQYVLVWKNSLDCTYLVYAGTLKENYVIILFIETLSV